MYKDLEIFNWLGKWEIKSSELSLKTTLKCGQAFRWKYLAEYNSW